MAKRLFTSESVTEGHPDKICDQISDAILDAIMEKDPNGRVACETCVSTGLIHIMGEITTHCYVDIPKIARQVVLDIGYDRAKYGFDGHTCAVITNIDEQSGDIAMGVDKSLEAKESGDSALDNVAVALQGSHISRFSQRDFQVVRTPGKMGGIFAQINLHSLLVVGIVEMLVIQEPTGCLVVMFIHHRHA